MTGSAAPDRSGLRIHLNQLREWPEAAAAGPVLERAARAAAAAAAGVGEISVTFLDTEGIRELNRRWLGRDRPTDVIAFALADDRTLGDVYIAVPVAAREAGERGHPLVEELARLVIHGVLHVFGHDHPEGEERDSSDMFRLQERVLREVL